MISKVSWLLSLAIIYSCFYRLGEAHITMKSCLGVWILFCCKIILSKNVSVKALSTNGFLRYVVQAQIKYYSKRSRSKIVHQSTCQHIQNVSVEDVGSFENLEDAYAAGYRLCRHCSPIAKLYRKESDVLQGYCQSHAASVFFKDRFIGISTPISDWRIIPSGKGNEVVLYHKNTLGDKKTGPVPGYHLQRVSQNTISGYLEYISDHDLYRNMHPLYPVQSKKNSPPPMKGTKRYRKEQKRAAKKARRQSIAHVLTLIENLDTQARVARSM